MSRPKGGSKIDVDEARRLRESGLSYAKIAETMGVRKQSVFEALGKPDAEKIPAIEYDLAVSRAMARCPVGLLSDDGIETEQPVRLRVE